MGKGNKQYYEFSNYIEETNNEHDSKNKIKILNISSKNELYDIYIVMYRKMLDSSRQKTKGVMRNGR